MKVFKVRPYHGHDCDSVNGFNNGSFLNTIIVRAENEDEAIDKAIQNLIERWSIDMNKWELNPSHMSDNTLYYEYPITDEEGNEVDQASAEFEFDEDKHFYRYEYITFEIDKDAPTDGNAVLIPFIGAK